MDFITRDDTILVAIDFQERLMPVMQDKEELAERSVCLVQKKAVERIAESFGRSGACNTAVY